MTIDAFALSAGDGGFPQVKATLSATTYLLPADQGLTAGATPAGRRPAPPPPRPPPPPSSPEPSDAVPDATSGVTSSRSGSGRSRSGSSPCSSRCRSRSARQAPRASKPRGRRPGRRGRPRPRPATRRGRRVRQGRAAGAPAPARRAARPLRPAQGAREGHRRPGALRQHAGLRQRRPDAPRRRRAPTLRHRAVGHHRDDARPRPKADTPVLPACRCASARRPAKLRHADDVARLTPLPSTSAPSSSSSASSTTQDRGLPGLVGRHADRRRHLPARQGRVRDDPAEGRRHRVLRPRRRRAAARAVRARPAQGHAQGHDDRPRPPSPTGATRSPGTELVRDALGVRGQPRPAPLPLRPDAACSCRPAADRARGSPPAARRTATARARSRSSTPVRQARPLGTALHRLQRRMALRLITAGESHGPGLTCIVEGLPAGPRARPRGDRPRHGAPPARPRPRRAHEDRARHAPRSPPASATAARSAARSRCRSPTATTPTGRSG